MIDVQAVLRDLPHFEKFASVAELHALAEGLRTDPRFTVNTPGSSANGVPIYHVRFGSGSVKALLVGFPHCMEPMGGLTIFSLLTLLRQGQRALLEADVEWNFVPCIDPDGARLNEGWNQQPFSFDSYMRNYHIQEPARQVDMSFPVAHKKLVWNRPSVEAQVLQGILDRIEPDFFYSLHNARMGGAFYYLSRDIGRQYYEQIYALLERVRFPLQKRPQWQEVFTQFGTGVLETVKYKKYYDHLEPLMAEPQSESVLSCGTPSWEYLELIKPSALTFTTELGYALHPEFESERPTGQNLRQFMLAIAASNQYLASVILEEWGKVKGELDPAHPLYRAVAEGWVVPDRDRVCEGGIPLSRLPTRHVLFSSEYDRTMTEADRFNACMSNGGYHYHLTAYQIVRLLRESRQTETVRRAIDRLDRAFAEAKAEIARHVDFDAFEVVQPDTIVKVQLGSGLIALNSLLRA